MATLQAHRRPLANRSIQPHSIYPSPAKQRTASGSKRPRSPDRQDVFSAVTTKRARATAPKPSTTVTRDVAKERRHVERGQQEEEFKAKYKRAFPTFRIYFGSVEVNSSMTQALKSRIFQLGGEVHDFFDKDKTHLITDVPIPTDIGPDKENIQESRPTTKNSTALNSPIKLTARADSKDPVVVKAVQWNMKIWTSSKLDSVLSRCLELTPVKIAGPPATSTAPQQSLSRLLQSEKIYGTTERDPTQRRHDYRYFTRGSFFVLLEDMRHEMATIAAHEYPIVKDKDKSSKRPWPVLHCHPLARTPFVPFDEKEKRRYERLQQLAKEGEAEQNSRKQELEVVKRKQEEHKRTKPGADSLRRVVSMSNMKRRMSHPVGKHDGPCINLDDDDEEDVQSAKASGYLASGAGNAYLAASGNSVSITSTTGTTSTTGQALRNTLPPSLVARMNQQVPFSRKPSTKDKGQIAEKQGLMGPPTTIPSKQPMLKKSKSTNTLRLPKREEGAKPGYCESCRTKFSDFPTHTESKKHRKFATNPANFQALDEVLNRVRRRTKDEVKREEARGTVDLFHRCKRNRHFRPDTPGRDYELSSP